MSSTLLDALTGLLSPPLVGRAAAELGESPEAVSRGYRAEFAAILVALANRADDPGAMRRVIQLAGGGALDDDMMIAIVGTASLNSPAAAPADAVALGRRLLAMLFGDHRRDVAESVARSAELRPSSASSLLDIAAPLVLAALRRGVREHALSGAALATLLLQQRDRATRSAPAGIGDILGVAPPADGAGAAEAAPRPAARARAPRWLWPALAVLPLAALAWVLGARCG
jgi:hypothetical protein